MKIKTKDILEFISNYEVVDEGKRVVKKDLDEQGLIYCCLPKGEFIVDDEVDRQIFTFKFLKKDIWDIEMVTDKVDILDPNYTGEDDDKIGIYGTTRLGDQLEDIDAEELATYDDLSLVMDNVLKDVKMYQNALKRKEIKGSSKEYKVEESMKLDEALRIDGFDAETQHAFDKLAAYLSVFKNRANPASPRYITKLNDFQLKFMNFMDKAETQKAKFQIKTYISEIQNLLDKAEPVPAKKERVNLGGGKMRTIKKVEREYANPNPNGGEYYDDNVHVYEAPAEEDDEEVQAAVETLRRRGARVTRK